MSLIKDIGGKVVQSFISLDDLVLGKGLIGEGVSQLGLTGRSVAGSLAVASNLAARTVHLGIQVGGKSARVTAEAVEGFVPGASLAKALAMRVDEEAAAAGERASELASHAVELVGGATPRNPLTNEEWLGKSAPRGYSWGELAADTAVDSLGRLATMPLALAVESAMKLASSRPGRVAVDSALEGVGMLLNLAPGSDSTELDVAGLRESLMAVTTSSGDVALSNAVDLGEAAVRLALGDTRKLKDAMEQAVVQAQLLAGHSELGELLPAIPVSATLKSRARSLVEHAPRGFLKALERGPDGEAPTAGRILAASLDDAENLRVFASEYPVVLALLGTNTTAFLTAALLDVNEIEAFVEDDGDGDRRRPWSATHLEANLGKAPDGPLFEATVHAAQDTAFAYASEVLGRDKALARVERLFGKDVRERLESDVSLDREVFQARRGVERDNKLRERITATTDGEELTRQLDQCGAQLASLETFTRSLFEYRPKDVSERMEILHTFLSLAGQDLALRGAGTSDGHGRAKALAGFEAWLDAAIA